MNRLNLLNPFDRLRQCPPAPAPAASRRRRLGLDLAAVDEDVDDARAVFEEVAVGDDDVGDLALLERAEAIGGAGDPRGVDRQRANGGVGGRPSFTARAALRTKSRGC